MKTRKIQRLIADKKSKLTDAELFGSASYRSYLQSIADNISGKYGRGAYVSLSYDPGNKEIACTNNYKIYLNTANNLTGSFSDRRHKNLVNIGIIGHEVGHILFTDFHIAKRYDKYFESGRLYPRKMTAKMFGKEEHKENLKELEAVLAEAEPNKLRLLSNFAFHISNIIEDGYIERLMKLRFPGTVAIGIELKNLRQSEMSPSLKDMLDNEFDALSIINNLLLQYAIHGNIENQEGICNEYTAFLMDAVPVLDDALSNDNPKERLMCVNMMLVHCWKYIKPFMEKIDKMPEEPESKSEDEESEAESENPSESTSETPQSKAAQEIISKLDSEMENSSETPENMNSISLIDQIGEDKNEGEQERLEHLKTDVENMLSNGTGSITKEDDYITETADHELENIVNQAAETAVYSAVEDNILDEIKKTVKDIDFGDIHKNVDIVIHRQKELSGSEPELYDRAMTELRPISKLLQKSIMNVIRQRQRGANERGLLMGSRIDHTAYYRNDGKIFTKRNRPNDEISLAVGILVDMSGSMCGERIRTAQAMTLVVYDFCKSLNIPVTIYGHDTTYGNTVNLYSFAEFDSVDGKDKYRLMNIHDGGSNRDGCAVRFVAEKLSGRSEECKLFIVVSDGQPADGGYYGTAAELDLQDIRKEYTNKGITFLAAAIGDDKPAIKRCYGESSFLDITDLKEFPMTIAKLIARYAVG